MRWRGDSRLGGVKINAAPRINIVSLELDSVCAKTLTIVPKR